MSLVDGSTTVLLSVGGIPKPGSGVVVKNYDLGYPTAREVVADLAGQHGSLDLTKYFGSRTVKLDVSVLDVAGSTRHQTMDTLRYLSRPGGRPQLVVQCDGWAQQRTLVLRGTPSSCVVGPLNAGYLEASLAWVVPTGVMNSATQELPLQPIPVTTTGVSFTTSFPMSFAPGSLSNMATATNSGTTHTPWVARFWGQATNITVTNRTTGATFVLNAPIVAGNYIQIDSAARTALMNNTPGNSMFNLIDFTKSSWWTLAPGDNVISVTAQSSDTNAICYFDFAPAWV